MKSQADCHRRHVDFAVGQEVLLSAKNSLAAAMADYWERVQKCTDAKAIGSKKRFKKKGKPACKARKETRSGLWDSSD